LIRDKKGITAVSPQRAIFALQGSARLTPAVPRPRRYAGADQPARLSLEIDTIGFPGEQIGVVSEDVLQTPFCALTRLVRSDRKRLPKVLVVAPLSGHFPILLRDLIIGLLPRHEVYLSDWVNARYVPKSWGPFDLSANISWVIEMIEWLGPGMNVVALCQAAVPALIATAHLAEKSAGAAPRSLVLVAAPIDPALHPTRVARLIRSRPHSWYEHQVIAPVEAVYPGNGRLVYPASIQLAGLQAYFTRHVLQSGELLGKFLRDDGCDPKRFPFMDLYSALMDLPAEIFLDIVRHIYQECSLWKGGLRARGEPVSFAAMMSTALMTVEGEYDDIAAPGQTRRAHDLCRSVPDARRRQLLVPGCGHFSLFHGDIWRARVLPELSAFIEG
jgi:poly(3-hydroxybutyrate) depolymerase